MKGEFIKVNLTLNFLVAFLLVGSAQVKLRVRSMAKSERSILQIKGHMQLFRISKQHFVVQIIFNKITDARISYGLMPRGKECFTHLVGPL